MMRLAAYTRTSPEAPGGFPVFATRLVLVVMARELMRRLGWRQRL